jgi:gamma-glutamyltranspeptidase/glutathione hydrolase
MTGVAAVNAPRLHHQWQPDTVMHEPNALSQTSADTLRSKGHQLTEVEVIGDANSIWIKEGRFYGAKDPREPGAAVGW